MVYLSVDFFAYLIYLYIYIYCFLAGYHGLVGNPQHDRRKVEQWNLCDFRLWNGTVLSSLSGGCYSEPLGFKGIVILGQTRLDES